MVTTCEDCRAAPPVRGERFCKDCRKARIAEMEAAGYLKRVPGRWVRSADRQEDRRATHEGESSPWGENAVRALEDGS